MNRIVTFSLCLLCLGCAGSHARERREQVSAYRAPLPDFETYRSAEGFGSARWGMTVDEVQAVVAPLTPVGDEVYDSNQEVAGRHAQVAYVFFHGHLGRVVVRIVGQDTLVSYDTLRAGLVKDLGRPAQSKDPRHNDDDAAKVAVAVGTAVVIGAVLLAVLAHDSHGHSAPAVSAPKVHAAAAVGATALAVRPRVQLRPDLGAVEWMLDAADWDAPQTATADSAQGEPDYASTWARADTGVDLVGRLSGTGEVLVWYESPTMARFATLQR